MQLSRKKPYYGWVIAAAGILIMAVSVGIVNNCTSLYIVPISEEMGYTRQATSVISTLIAIGNMFVSAFSADLYHHFSVKRTMQVAAVVVSFGCFLFSRSQQLWQFYIISTVMSFAMWMLAYIPFAVILSNWFHKRTGFVIGLTYMGTGVGGMIFSPIIGSIIANAGWRQAMATMAVVMASVLIPCTMLLRDRPEEMGLQPYGYNEEKEVLQHRDTLPGIPFAVGKYSAKFIFMCLAIAVISAASSAFTSNLAAHLSSCGYTIESASRIVSASMAALAVGKISLGWTYDKLGSKKGVCISGVMLTICLVGTLFLPGTVPLIIILVCASLGIAFASVGIPIVAKAAFGIRDFERYNGALNAGIGVLSALAPIISGYIYDTTGQYNAAFILFAVAAAVSATILVICLWKPQNWEE